MKTRRKNTFRSCKTNSTASLGLFWSVALTIATAWGMAYQNPQKGRKNHTCAHKEKYSTLVFKWQPNEVKNKGVQKLSLKRSKNQWSPNNLWFPISRRDWRRIHSIQWCTILLHTSHLIQTIFTSKYAVMLLITGMRRRDCIVMLLSKGTKQ